MLAYLEKPGKLDRSANLFQVLALVMKFYKGGHCVTTPGKYVTPNSKLSIANKPGCRCKPHSCIKKVAKGVKIIMNKGENENQGNTFEQ